jgi:hypothetical protein
MVIQGWGPERQCGEHHIFVVGGVVPAIRVLEATVEFLRGNINDYRTIK